MFCCSSEWKLWLILILKDTDLSSPLSIATGLLEKYMRLDSLDSIHFQPLQENRPEGRAGQWFSRATAHDTTVHKRSTIAWIWNVLQRLIYWRFGTQWSNCQRWGFWEKIVSWGFWSHQWVIHWWVYNLMDYWELMETRRLGIARGSRSLEACLEGYILSPGTSPQLCFSVTWRRAALLHHLLPTMMPS